MFGFHEESHYVSEYDYENLISDNYCTSNRKSSFIDLLSNGKFISDSNSADALNLESYSNDLENHEISEAFAESEPVQLLLDDFPDIAPVKKPKEIKPKAQFVGLLKSDPTQIIGTLTVQQRIKKIEKYLEKKKKRTWKKKIHYDCRKKVADNRLRIKGRFVTSSKSKLCISEKDAQGASQINPEAPIS